MQKVIILSGAGISKESGLSTFRDQNGLWENHDIMEVASISGWEKKPELVLKFYNARRRQLKQVAPNLAHKLCASLEQNFRTQVITQNVDDLHERAGSSSILHLHGELLKARSTYERSLVYSWKKDIKIGDVCEYGYQLRPHIVWFGESVPEMENAIYEMQDCDVLIIVGTSLLVYPAASLINYVPTGCLIYYVDPRPNVSYEMNYMQNITVIQDKATTGLQKVVDILVPDL